MKRALILVALAVAGSLGTGATAAADQPGPVQITIGVQQQWAAVSIGVDAQPGLVTVGTMPDSGHITVSRASDALGAPVYAPRRPLRALQAAGAPPSGAPLGAFALTSGFGTRRHPLLGGLRLHAGVDLAAPTGTPIFATSDGMVSAAQWQGGYGLLVALDHGRGVQTRYGHLSRLNVAAGQRVRKGDVIGFVGSTGRSTGPHLHYEIRNNGQALNPISR
jgi:murein DD-endopeptidase MepM/ murein hydrolase activator NlpD